MPETWSLIRSNPAKGQARHGLAFLPRAVQASSAGKTGFSLEDDLQKLQYRARRRQNMWENVSIERDVRQFSGKKQ